MFDHIEFDVAPIRSLELQRLGWPAPGEAGHDSALGGNRHYGDLRRLSWTDATRVLEVERELIGRIEVAVEPEAECDLIEDELYEGDEDLFGLDLGVAATVVALSAARCVPFSSCNGGAFGGTHSEIYPLIAFFARPPAATVLLPLVEEIGVGLENGDNGCLIAYANDIRKFPNFAASIIRERKVFDEVNVLRRRRSIRGPKEPQMTLPLEERKLRQLMDPKSTHPGSGPQEQIADKRKRGQNDDEQRRIRRP